MYGTNINQSKVQYAKISAITTAVGFMHCVSACIFLFISFGFIVCCCFLFETKKETERESKRDWMKENMTVRANKIGILNMASCAINYHNKK